MQAKLGWQPSELAADPRWLLQSTPEEARHLVALAEDTVARLGPDPNALLATSAADFDLGPLAARLPALLEELRSGSGVALYRGLPMDQLSRHQAAVIYWAIGLHLGRPKSNNPEGDMIGHIVNTGGDYDKPTQRGYQTNVEMDFHCDQSDVVGLLCLHPARAGGLSKVTSSPAVYHALKATRPDLVDVLSQPFCWTKHAETSSGEAPYYESPVFNFAGNILSTSFGPTHMIKGHNLPEAPDMSAAQREAIDEMWRLANDLHYAMALQRGDIQFANNYTILHTRTAFEDGPDPAQRRTLWRLWLTVDDFMPRTPYAEQWLGGVAPAGTKPRITLDYFAKPAD